MTTAGTLVSTAAGLGLIGLVGRDAFDALFHAEGRGTFSRQITRAVWQVFRRVTAPLLAPVLTVVFVTLVINVLKIFDIVYVLEQQAGNSAPHAEVLATQLYSQFGLLHYGVASAIGVLLVLIVIPFMALNIRRFRRENQ